MPDRPNILYIFTDQQEAGAMSCAGNRDLRTPAMDSIAERGVRFEKTYCSFPLCTPSRASMFTGMMPHQVGINGNGKPIADEQRGAELGPVLADHGYECVYGGKWHVPELAMPESRSSIIMDYGDAVRANIQTNHFHKYGPRHQESYIKWEGTRGCIMARMGLLMNYPEGLPDAFEVCTFKDGEPVWESFDLEGSWFPDAFVGSMAQLMRAADGEQDALVTPVGDIIEAMPAGPAVHL